MTFRPEGRRHAAGLRRGGVDWHTPDLFRPVTDHQVVDDGALTDTELHDGARAGGVLTGRARARTLVGRPGRVDARSADGELLNGTRTRVAQLDLQHVESVLGRRPLEGLNLEHWCSLSALQLSEMT